MNTRKYDKVHRTRSIERVARERLSHVFRYAFGKTGFVVWAIVIRAESGSTAQSPVQCLALILTVSAATPPRESLLASSTPCSFFPALFPHSQLFSPLAVYSTVSAGAPPSIETGNLKRKE